MSLLETQRTMAAAIMTPMRKPVPRDAAALVMPNTRLTSAERIDIYRESYWTRVLDSLRDDFPGLQGIVGPRAFDRLARAYLADCPSQSFTLRDLGSRLHDWLREHPAHANPNPTLALDMIRLEWVHIEAFDAATRKPLGPEDIAEANPRMRFVLQPHLRLLAMSYPVDYLRVELAAQRDRSAERRVLRRHNRAGDVFIAVHRPEFAVHYRRLAPGEFRLLETLGRGTKLEDALADVIDSPGSVQSWFRSWAELGWLCSPKP
jgi:hypothetical protein